MWDGCSAAIKTDTTDGGVRGQEDVGSEQAGMITPLATPRRTASDLSLALTLLQLNCLEDLEFTVEIIRLRARELVLMGESYILPKDFASSWGGGDKFLCRGAGTALRERYDFDNLSK
jgi:hypothetical protein